MRRITVVEHVTLDGDIEFPQPLQLVNYHSRNLKTGEQPYQRTLKISNQWVNLQRGWIEAHSLLCLVHDLPPTDGKVPTKEQKLENASRRVEIKFGEVVFHLFQGESLRCNPATLEDIQIRSNAESAKVSITILPE